MADRYIKDRSNFEIGRIIDLGDFLEARYRDNFTVGTYHKKDNVTKSRTGFTLAQGDILASLLWDHHQQKKFNPSNPEKNW